VMCWGYSVPFRSLLRSCLYLKVVVADLLLWYGVPSTLP
jgi:hypothetical protein